MPSVGPSLPGLDLDAVTRWARDHLREVVPPLEAVQLLGGRSNLTFRLTDAYDHRVVLRRPPSDEVLATAHDMAREHRILEALAPTAVPVPKPFGFCADLSGTGAHFSVVSYVQGATLVDDDEVDEHLGGWIGPDDLAWSLLETLAALHQLDPAEVGLADLGAGHSYVERQLRRWRLQLEAASIEVDQRMWRLHHRLERQAPPQSATAVVHGDYRLGNCIVVDGRVRAVVDWELCTLGEPLADLGYLLLDWEHPGVPAPVSGICLTAERGFPDVEDAVRRYESVGGRHATDLAFYLAFAAWRKAAILEGVRARATSGPHIPQVDHDLEVLVLRRDRYLDIADRYLG